MRRIRASDGRMYLVTGGSGAIGSALARYLRCCGAAVRVFDVRSPGSSASGVEFIQGDVRDVGRLATAMRNINAVFHLAEVTVGDRMPPEIVHGVNSGGTANALCTAREAGVRRFVLRSSADVYGEACRSASEDASVVGLRDDFVASRLEAEAHCARAHREGGLETVVLRTSWVVGTSDTDAWLRPLLWALRHNRPIIMAAEGRHRLHVTAMSDCVAAFGRAAAAVGVSGEVYNIAGADAPAAADLVHALRTRLGSSSPVWRVPQNSAARVLRWLARLHLIPLLPDQVPLLYADRVLDTTKAAQRLDWSARLGAEDAVMEAVAMAGS